MSSEKRAQINCKPLDEEILEHLPKWVITLREIYLKGAQNKESTAD